MSHAATLPLLSLSAAEALIEAATSEAKARGLSLVFAVADPAGQLIALRRMDGAGRISIDVAIGKAKTAGLFGKDTDLFSTMIDEGAASMLSVPGATLISGGVAVVVDGQSLGALGVSGGTGTTDNEIAQAAVRKFMETLK